MQDSERGRTTERGRGRKAGRFTGEQEAKAGWGLKVGWFTRTKELGNCRGRAEIAFILQKNVMETQHQSLALI